MPTYLSGYGIVGIVLILILIISMYKSIKKFKNTPYEHFYSWSILSIITFIPLSIVSSSIYGEYYIIFIITFSFITINKDKIIN